MDKKAEERLANASKRQPMYSSADADQYTTAKDSRQRLVEIIKLVEDERARAARRAAVGAVAHDEPLELGHAADHRGCKRRLASGAGKRRLASGAAATVWLAGVEAALVQGGGP